MTDYLRRRTTAEDRKEEGENGFHSFDEKSEHDVSVKYIGLTLWHCLLVLVFHVLIFFLAVYAHHYVPESKVNASKGDFAEWRARKHLQEITSYGIRPAGSFANEHKTVEYLLNTLRSFKEAKRDDIVLEIGLQRPSGTYSIDFLEGFTSYYKNISNVVARVSSKEKYPAKHSILVNAHFDSSFGGPGASDDVVSCATMLEVIRCLTESNAHIELNHSLIFLFNGAEENFLQASHGFITQHPWAEDIRVFVNLEAAGAGGRELVFQTGPNHPWLIKIYANSANYPYANIVGQEFFQTGLLPAETDFRIFRDYGNIPGVDIAYVTNGYVYHTTRDLPEAITLGSVQRAGENLLGMLTRLSQSPLVADPSGDQHGAMVFYDFLGLYMVLYPQRIGWILNSLIAVVTFVCIVLKFSKKSVKDTYPNSKGVTRNSFIGGLYVTSFIKALFYIVLSWILSFLFVFLIAKVITASGQSMSWYCKPYVLIGLYVVPGMLVMCGIHYWQATHFRENSSWSERWSQEAHMFYANLFIWNTILSVMNYFNLGSAYLFMLVVAFSLFGRVFLWEICLRKARSTSSPGNCNAFVMMHLLSVTIPNLLWSYIFWMHLEFIIPIFGRTGSNDPPDVAISILVTFFLLVVLSFSVSLVHVVSHVKPLIFSLIGTWLLCSVLVLTGSIFPYSAEPWCPKRVVFQHISRTFHDRSGEVSHRDAGLWVIPFDYLGVKHIDHLPEFKDAQIPNIGQGLFGDFPYYMPVSFMFDNTWYISGPVPEVSTVTTLKLLSKESGKKGRTIKLTFELDGPSHMSLHLSPKPGVEIIDSSLGELYERSFFKEIHATSQPQYFVYYSHGIYTGPWSFWVELESFSATDSLIDIALTGHYSHGEDSKSKFMTHFVDKLPEWVDPTAWVSTYKKYIF